MIKLMGFRKKKLQSTSMSYKVVLKRDLRLAL